MCKHFGIEGKEDKELRKRKQTTNEKYMFSPFCCYNFATHLQKHGLFKMNPSKNQHALFEQPKSKHESTPCKYICSFFIYNDTIYGVDMSFLFNDNIECPDSDCIPIIEKTKNNITMSF